MTSKEDFLRSLQGISLDGKKAQTEMFIPTHTESDPDGFITLFGGGQEIRPDTVYTTRDIGPTLMYERSTNPDNPYLFTQGGYEVTYNKNTGEYTYTIHPSYDVDFSYIESLKDLEKKNALLLVESIKPTITIESTLNKDTNPTTRIGIGPSDLELFRVSGKQTCPGFITNVSVNYREELGKFHIAAAHSNILTVTTPNGKNYFKPVVTAELAAPTESMRFVLNEYASASAQNPPRRKDLYDFAKATVGLKEFDPFDHYSV